MVYESSTQDKKNKIGFVLSISTGDEIERKKIIEDFVLTLHELLKGGASGNSFQIINLPEYVAGEIIDHEHAQEIRKRCRAHFLIFGRVRLRDICGKQEHVLHLEGQVAHKPLPSNLGAEFAKEFTELFPRRLRIATENDIFSFAFTSDWINCVSRYIIGIAAVCSGDLDYAEKLQKDVESLLANKDPSFPIFAILKKRVPIRLGEIYQAQANISYERWVKNHDPAEITEMGNYLDKIPPSYANEYPVVLLKSVFLFLQYRDVRGALQVVKYCRTIHEGTWLYNRGFLHAYMGNLKKAIQCYNKALGLSIEPLVIAKIEEFIVWVIEQEPSNYQLYYCLGYLNYKIKGDDKSGHILCLRRWPASSSGAKLYLSMASEP